MSSSGVSRANANRAIRQEALREQLAAQGHVQHVVDICAKLSDLDQDMEALDVQRLKGAMDGHLKLVDKYLPSLKSTELTGDGGGPLSLSMNVEFD